MHEKLDAAGFTVSLEAKQDNLPVRGNAMSSGDDEADAQYEDEIIARLESGDEWAWASVVVYVSHRDFPGIVGKDHLGGCNYKDADDFRQSGGYYEDMLHEALTDWCRQVKPSPKRAAVYRKAERIVNT